MDEFDERSPRSGETLRDGHGGRGLRDPLLPGPLAQDDDASAEVQRADLRRSRQAVLGGGMRPEVARFASQLARAISDSPGGIVPSSGHEPHELPTADPRAARYVHEEVTVGAQQASEVTTDPRPMQVVGAGPAPSGLGAVALGEPDGPPGPDPELTDPRGSFPRIPRLPEDARLSDAEQIARAARILPALREAVLGTSTLPPGTLDGFGPGGVEVVPLPSAPAVVCDDSDRIVRVNQAFLRLSDRRTDDPDHGPLGMRIGQLVAGPDTDARLVRPDHSLVRVRVVRWELPGALRAVLFVELDQAPGASEADRRWTAELERIARVGTWTFDLATATLTRTETLDELYRAVGVTADTERGPLEGEQVALLCRGLRSGTVGQDHHVELRLPGDRVLSCRAGVERSADGTPVRLVGMVRDVSAQRVADGRVQHSGQRFLDLMATVTAGIGLLDASGRLVDANPALCALLDAPLEYLRGTSALQLTAEPDADAEGLPRWLRRIPPGARHGYRIDALALLRGDGTRVWCEVGVTASMADDGGVFWLIVCTDVGEQRRAAELLRSAATTDELTRLPNRAAALDLLDRLLAGPGRDRVALVCGDLDDFARVNSSLGHEAGDDLLVALAGRLQRELPFGCTAARLSADEFVVICSDHADAGGPDALARTVADMLRTTVTVHGSPVHLTASVGLATPSPDDDVSASDLLRFAEVAMHDVKKNDRGGVGIACEGVVSTATRQLELEAELRAAIASDGLLLEYQPVVGPDGLVHSAEALVRWPHPERGVIPPGEFLPVAQRGGLLRDLDLWVLRTAAKEAAGWTTPSGRGVAVAVNLAGLLPSEPDFLTQVTAAVADAGLMWDQLVLELVETSMVALPRHALDAMAELVTRGVRFAVDDFGTGYSSLARLKELPAQTVKVDRSFVTGIAEDPADFAVARAVVDMAHAMGRSTVAEGVETAEQFHVLRGLGVDAYQGWLFARPLRADAMRRVLLAERLPTPATAIGA
ncbi:MAG: EAL domain-containing protein [Pseudonocardia sp.]|nr:EAL domain-containing protein [Pseudonocardia sp.]